MKALTADEAYGVGLLVAWLGMNIVLNFLSKWENTPKESGGFGQSFPWLQAVSDQTIALITVVVIFRVRPEQNLVTRAQFMMYRGRLFLLATLSCICIVSNNGSLITIGLSLNQIIKCCSPLPVLVLSRVFEKKRFSGQHVASVMLLVASAIISVPMNSWTSSTTGILLALTAMLIGAMRNVLAAYLMADAKDHGLTPLVLVFYNALFSIGVCVTVWLAVELRDSMAFFAEQPGQAVGVMIGISLLSAFYNLVSFSATKATSALTFTIAGTTKQVLLIVVSAIVMDHVTGTMSWIGIASFAIALTWYSKLSYDAKRAGEKAAAVHAISGGKEALSTSIAPTETTPLSSASTPAPAKEQQQDPGTNQNCVDAPVFCVVQ